MFTGNVSVSQIGKLKEASSDLPTIFVFEEIVTHVESSASALLDFLDGESSWNNILILAATNYPEKLPRNFVDRPARFDSLYKFGAPAPQVVEEYLVSKLGKDAVTEKLLDSLAKEPTLSIAYLKELASAVIVFAKDPLKMIQEFKKRKELVKKEFADEKKINIGFGNGRWFDSDDED